MTADEIVADLEKMPSCSRCAAALCAHHGLMCLVMGFKSTPLCEPCLSKELGRDVREQLHAYILTRDCYREAWAWADRRERVTGKPACVWPAG